MKSYTQKKVAEKRDTKNNTRKKRWITCFGAPTYEARNQIMHINVKIKPYKLKLCKRNSMLLRWGVAL